MVAAAGLLDGRVLSYLPLHLRAPERVAHREGRQRLRGAGRRDDRAPPDRRLQVELAERMWIRTSVDDDRSTAARIVDEALRESTIVNLDYEDAHGRCTESRSVEPLVFARTGSRWYLLAWCRQRASGRWFRMDHIRDARATRERFEPRDLDAVFGTSRITPSR